MKIIPTPDMLKKTANTFVRSVVRRPEINAELFKLRKLGIDHKQEQVCRRILESLNTLDQPKFTLALSIFLKQGAGKDSLHSFKVFAGLSYEVTQGLDYSALKRVNDLIDSTPFLQNRFAHKL